MNARIRPNAGVHVIVPVKNLEHAKSRLAPAVGAADRRMMVLAMLEDTLRALGASDAVAALTVLTPDDAVADRARGSGAEVLAEADLTRLDADSSGDADSGDRLNAVLTAASAAVRAEFRPANLAIVQADLPALRADEFTAAFRSALRSTGPFGGDPTGADPAGGDSTGGDSAGWAPDRVGTAPWDRDVRGGRAFVADRPGTGTTALFACGPRTAPAPRFGPGSARAHRSGGALPLTGAWPGLRHDFDTVADLAAAHRLEAGSATRAAVAALRHPLARSAPPHL